MTMAIAAKATGRHHVGGRHARPKGLLNVGLAGRVLVLVLALYSLRQSPTALGIVAGLFLVTALTRFAHHEGDRHRKIETDPSDSEPDKISRLYLLTVSFDLLVVFLQHVTERPAPPLSYELPEVPLYDITPVHRIGRQPSLHVVPVKAILTDQKLIERFDSLRVGGEPGVTQGSWQKG